MINSDEKSNASGSLLEVQQESRIGNPGRGTFAQLLFAPRFMTLDGLEGGIGV